MNQSALKPLIDRPQLVLTGSYGSVSATEPGAIAISQKIPAWWVHYRAREGQPLLKYSKLAPPMDLVWAYKRGEVTERDYLARYYREILNNLDAEQVLQDLLALVPDSAPSAVPILLCWEAPGKFCHRRSVGYWLEDHLDTVNAQEYSLTPPSPQASIEVTQLDIL